MELKGTKLLVIGGTRLIGSQSAKIDWSVF
jgi:hypothetical protein